MTSPSSQPDASRRSHWVNHLERHAHGRPDAAALRFEGATTTWRQLHDRVERLAAALAARGVGSGDRVAVLMGNRPEYLEVLLAATRAGAIGVPVNFRLAPGEVAYILGDSGATVLVVDPLGAEAAAAAVAQVDHEVALVGVGADVAGGTAYDDVLAEDHDPLDPVDVPEDSPAAIMYTSGTTGRPKGAVLTHQNLLSPVGGAACRPTASWRARRSTWWPRRCSTSARSAPSRRWC